MEGIASPTQSREEALHLLEKVRREYISNARYAAQKLYITTRKPVTVDDVREVCPPPEGVDGRVMGAILREPEWIKSGYVNSSRKISHRRPISQFVWTGVV